VSVVAVRGALLLRSLALWLAHERRFASWASFRSSRFVGFVSLVALRGSRRSAAPAPLALRLAPRSLASALLAARWLARCSAHRSRSGPLVALPRSGPLPRCSRARSVHGGSWRAPAPARASFAFVSAPRSLALRSRAAPRFVRFVRFVAARALARFLGSRALLPRRFRARFRDKFDNFPRSLPWNFRRFFPPFSAVFFRRFCAQFPGAISEKAKLVGVFRLLFRVFFRFFCTGCRF